MRDAERCQSCGATAPTRFVDFKQNIGLLVARRSSTVAGNFGKPCVHKHFWTTAGTTVAVGWMSRFSVFIAPVFVVNNLVRYVSVLGMPGPGGGGQSQGGGRPEPGREMAVGVGTARATAARIASARSAPPPPLPDPAEVLKPYSTGMVARIQAKETLTDVAADVADQTGLTADEVSDYVKDRVRRANAAKAANAAAAQPARV